MSHIRNKNQYGILTNVAWVPTIKTTIGNLAAIGDIEGVQECLDSGVNTGQTGYANNKPGRTALIRACVSNQYEVVEHVLELDAELECRDSSTGRTPLLWSSIFGRTRIAELLINYGANLEVEDSQFLRRPLCWAAFTNSLDICKLLVERNVDIDAVDHCGRTALMWASDKGYYDIVKYLVQQGASLEIDEYRNAHTALVLAASSGHADIVGFLIDNGARYYDVVEHGADAVEMAATGNHLNAVELLARSMNELPNGNKLEAAQAYHKLATLCLNNGLKQKALEAFGQSQVLFTALGTEVFRSIISDATTNIERLKQLIEQESKTDVDAADM